MRKTCPITKRRPFYPISKTHKATAKRSRRTKGGKGKLMRPKQGKSHFRRKKSRPVKRLFDEMVPVEPKSVRKHLRRLAPYLGD